MIPRYFVVAERDHEIQNPTSEEKLLLLGERLRLGPDSRVLDIASGRGGPALVLAGAFGCRIDGIELRPEFHAAAVERAEARGLSHLVGYAAVGELFWRRLPLPGDYEDRREPWTTLADTVVIFETSALPVVAVIASSEDDWDRYETLHWRTVEAWLAANPDDPGADDLRRQNERAKRNYLQYQREYLGWAIFVGWKR